MFDLVRNNKKIVQIFLLLICLPFVFFGVESYVNRSPNSEGVAQINDFVIYPQMFDNALRERQNQLRIQLGDSYDSSKTNTKQFKLEVLNSLINEQLLLLEAKRLKLFVSDEQVRQAISEIDAFYDDNGNFSTEKYNQLLSAQGLSAAMFENDVRKTLLQRQLVGTIVKTSIKSNTLLQKYFFEYNDKYVGKLLSFPAENYKSKVVFTDELIKKYYEEHKNNFVSPARIKVDYLIFSDKTISDNLTSNQISDEEINNYYQSNLQKFTSVEERKVNHILFNKDDKSKAEEILQTLLKNSQNFAEVAKNNSIDPISAKNGGDVGFIKKDFEISNIADAAFQIKNKGDIFPQLIETNFGLHILQLTDIKAKMQQPLADVKNEIINILKAQKAQKLFAEQSENFTNSVYDQADSLEPTAKQFNLKIQHTDWISQGDLIADDGEKYAFITPKLADTLFDKNFIEEKHNSDAIDIGNNALVSARIAAYEDKKQQSLSAVENEIKEILMQQETLKLAKKDVDDLLNNKELLSKNFANKSKENTFEISQMSVLEHTDSKVFHPEIVRTILSFPKNKTKQLPLYKSVEIVDNNNPNNNGYYLIQLENIISKNDGKNNIVINNQTEPTYMHLFNLIDENYTGSYFQQWIIALRNKYNVKINEKALEDNK